MRASVALVRGGNSPLLQRRRPYLGKVLCSYTARLCTAMMYWDIPRVHQELVDTENRSHAK